MRSRGRTPAFAALLLFTCAALVASALLWVDYARPTPIFCDPLGGCGAVKATIFAYPFAFAGIRVSMPTIGIGGILTVGLLSLWPGRRARIVQAVFGAIG